MGWPLPLHVLIKITRECKTDFLNASCLFFLSFLPTSFSCCFLGVPGLVVGDITTVAELERRRVGFLLLLRLLFRHPSERDFFVFFGHLPPFSVALLLLGWVTWFGYTEVHDGPVLG